MLSTADRGESCGSVNSNSAINRKILLHFNTIARLNPPFDNTGEGTVVRRGLCLPGGVAQWYGFGERKCIM